jgi:hypothetical protein
MLFLFIPVRYRYFCKKHSSLVPPWHEFQYSFPVQNLLKPQPFPKGHFHFHLIVKTVILGKLLILPSQVLFRETLCLAGNIYNNLNLTFDGRSRMAHVILLVKVTMLDDLCTECTFTKQQVSLCLYLVFRYFYILRS